MIKKTETVSEWQRLLLRIKHLQTDILCHVPQQTTIYSRKFRPAHLIKTHHNQQRWRRNWKILNGKGSLGQWYLWHLSELPFNSVWTWADVMRCTTASRFWCYVCCIAGKRRRLSQPKNEHKPIVISEITDDLCMWRAGLMDSSANH